ncbi:HEXXH motif-containing putative peptide modification protein [Streptomyces sp. XM83C]|uniref:HEXXH motif-containing putative peptide modification protein n=1 Tax=Streptomyces thermocoprophilus TaxID=78356 RepID=A0ABV5V7H6_9ACTN|nr:HEXXH motif-containing putative peptide modification protein [Streptomyces sp. XM83C]MCK1822132.1 HEXXH motif-containing putative peptide modification protein [Streptomyces sp. XM83C]
MTGEVLRVFRIDVPLLDRMAAGGGGGEALRLLGDAEYARRLLLLRALLDRAREHGGGVAAEVAGLFEVLARARRADPGVTRRVLTHPSVGSRLVATWQELAKPGPALPLAEVAAAVAVAAGVPAEVTLAGRGPGAVLPGVGAAVLADAAPGTRVRLRAGALESEGGTSVRVPGGGPCEALPQAGAGGRWWPLRVVWPESARGGGRAADVPGVVLDDVDPVAAPGVPRMRLGTGEVRAWRDGAAGAMRLLRARHPGYAGEVAVGLRALVPLPADDATHRSSSAAERFGAVVMTRPASHQWFAETLVHETQHSKLVAVLHLIDLVEPGASRGPLLYAPWRDDPRPPAALLHGTYAFLSVARFWAVEAASASDPGRRYDAQVRCARWREAAAEAAGTLLAHGDVLTGTGRRFVTVMDAELAELRRVPLSVAAVREARREAEEHRRLWRSRHAEHTDEQAHSRTM